MHYRWSWSRSEWVAGIKEYWDALTQELIDNCGCMLCELTESGRFAKGRKKV